ncbi:hypothetical protein RI054_12g61640 [Pseudoscourfieldia marina]
MCQVRVPDECARFPHGTFEARTDTWSARSRARYDARACWARRLHSEPVALPAWAQDVHTRRDVRARWVCQARVHDVCARFPHGTFEAHTDTWSARSRTRYDARACCARSLHGEPVTLSACAQARVPDVCARFTRGKSELRTDAWSARSRTRSDARACCARRLHGEPVALPAWAQDVRARRDVRARCVCPARVHDVCARSAHGTFEARTDVWSARSRARYDARASCARRLHGEPLRFRRGPKAYVHGATCVQWFRKGASRTLPTTSIKCRVRRATRDRAPTVGRGLTTTESDGWATNGGYSFEDRMAQDRGATTTRPTTKFRVDRGFQLIATDPNAFGSQRAHSALVAFNVCAANLGVHTLHANQTLGTASYYANSAEALRQEDEMLCHHAHLQGLVLHELTYIPEDDAFVVSAVSAASGRLVHAHPRQFVNLRTRVADWEWSGGSALIVSSRRRSEAGHWLAHYAAFVYAAGTWWDLDGRHPPHALVHPIACLASHLESIRLLVSPDDSDPAAFLHELVLHQLSVDTPPPLVASQASSAPPLDDAALLDVPAEDPDPAEDAATQEFIAEISRIFSEMRDERRLRRGGGAGGPNRPRSYRTRASAHPLLRHTSWWEAQEGLCCLRHSLNAALTVLAPLTPRFSNLDLDTAAAALPGGIPAHGSSGGWSEDVLRHAAASRQLHTRDLVFSGDHRAYAHAERTRAARGSFFTRTF